MKLYYYAHHSGNLGDDLNNWLWRRVFKPNVLDDGDTDLFIGIGTILDHAFPPSAHRTVCTSGIGYGPRLPNLKTRDWNVIAVRGPLTARVLGVDKGLTDGAILLRACPELYTPPQKRKGVVFMPHVANAPLLDWPTICKAAGVEYLDPRGEHVPTLKRLGSAKLVLADAMHAAIIADALRVPWVPLSVSVEMNTFKWLDFAMSLNIPYTPTHLPVRSVALLFREAWTVIKSQNARFKVSDAPFDDALNHFHAFRQAAARRGKLKACLIKAAAKPFHLLEGIASRHAVLTKGIFCRGATIRLLKEAARNKGVLSDEKVAATAFKELAKRLHKAGLTAKPLKDIHA